MNQEPVAGLGRYFRTYLNCVALVLLLAGVAMYLATSGTDIQLVKEDAVFGLKNQTLLMLAAVFHVGVGVCLFVPGGLPQRGLLALWVGWCHLIYYFGMLWMKATSPFPSVQLVGWKLGANNPRIVDVFWKCFILVLIAGSVWYLVLDWRETKRAGLELFLKSWKNSRRQGPGSTPPTGAASSTDRPPSIIPTEFKISCPACGQHIRCDTSYSGRVINCPNCQSRFKVPEKSSGTGAGVATME